MNEITLSERDIDDILKYPQQWLASLDEAKERCLYDAIVEYRNVVQDIHYFHYKKGQLAKELMAKNRSD